MSELLPTRQNEGYGACDDEERGFRMDNMEQTETLDREQLEQQMEQALIRRAVGYDYTETRREWAEKEGQRVTEKVTEQRHHVPPDLRALMFWLKNRCPQRWRDKPEGGREEMEGQEMVKIIDDL